MDYEWLQATLWNSTYTMEGIAEYRKTSATYIIKRELPNLSQVHPIPIPIPTTYKHATLKPDSNYHPPDFIWRRTQIFNLNKIKQNTKKKKKKNLKKNIQHFSKTNFVTVFFTCSVILNKISVKRHYCKTKERNGNYKH